MRYFYEHFIAPPNVEPQNRIFSPEHFFLSGIVLILIGIILYHAICKWNNAQLVRCIRVSAYVLLGLEVFRIIWKCVYYGISFDVFRFDWCNQICMLTALAILFRWEAVYDVIFTMGLLGGLGVMIYPLWVFYDYAGIHLMSVQSMFSHGLIILIPLLLPLSYGYQPSLKRLKYALIGLATVFGIAFVMSHIQNENYLIMLSAQGLPIISLIPYPYYIFVAYLCAAAGVALCLYVGSKLFPKILQRRASCQTVWNSQQEGEMDHAY